MKNFKLLSLAFIAIVALTVSSCNEDPGEVYSTPFTITEINYSVEGNASTTDLLSKFTVANTTAEAITLRWVRQNVSVPTEWGTAICDHNLCWDRTVSEQDLEIPANDEVEIKFTFYPENTSGSGTAELVLYDKANQSESTQTLTLSATAR